MKTYTIPFLIQVSSPNPLKYKEVQKSQFNQTHWMPPWSRDEIDELSTIKTIPKDAVNFQFTHYGGIPRYVFDLSSKGIEPLNDAIRWINIKHIVKFIGESPTLESAHKLFHNIPGENYNGHTIDFGSDYIKKEVLKRMVESQREKTLNNLKLEGFLHSTPGGFFFEECSHQTIQYGGHFEIAPLHIIAYFEQDSTKHLYLPKDKSYYIDVKDNENLKTTTLFTYFFGNKTVIPISGVYPVGTRRYQFVTNINDIQTNTITIPPSSNCHFNITNRYDDISTVKESEYSVPSSKNEPCIDAIYKISPNKIIFFQITCNKDHKMKYFPFLNLIKKFPTDSLIELFWVVPSTIFKEFKFQAFLDQQDHVMNFNDLDNTVKKVNQYVLHMSDLKLREILFESQSLIHKKSKLEIANK